MSPAERHAELVALVEFLERVRDRAQADGDREHENYARAALGRARELERVLWLESLDELATRAAT